MQARRALAYGEPAPLSAQCLAGGATAASTMSSFGFGDLGDDAAVGGIHVGELALAAHEFAIDVVED